jgi:hypothetical protein
MVGDNAVRLIDRTGPANPSGDVGGMVDGFLPLAAMPFGGVAEIEKDRQCLGEAFIAAGVGRALGKGNRAACPTEGPFTDLRLRPLRLGVRYERS